MILPDPALTLTIPSIHDGTVLDCRVYHPASLAANPHAPPWRRHAAVFAHPYAPLGGSYDDPVLEVVCAQLLRKGYLVGTFNFRGAGHSTGRTSWSAKPERDDYASFVGFLVYYIHFLDPFKHHATDSDHHGETTHPVDHDAEPDAGLEPRPAVPRYTDSSIASELMLQRPVLLLGGYSYGAMITTKLPPLDQLLQAFASPHADSDAAQIRLRAEHLAQQENLVLGSARAAMRQARSLGSPSKRSPSKHGLRIGGDEGGSPRRSHESFGRRSLSLDADDKLRKGVHEFMSKRKPGKHAHRLHLRAASSSASASASNLTSQASATEDSESPVLDSSIATKSEQIEEKADGKLPPVADLIIPQPAYLLVSPLRGVITHLATFSLVPSALSSKTRSPGEEAAEEKLAANHTLAVYGDEDGFVPVGKLRQWVGRMRDKDGSRFRGEEFTAGGHFWAEEGVLYKMRDMVGEFAGRLVNG